MRWLEKCKESGNVGLNAIGGEKVELRGGDARVWRVV